MINFRKWICKKVKEFSRLWWWCDCIRYAPAPEPPKPPDPPKPEVVQVKTCVGSGRLASPWCPETIWLEFIKGHEPTSSCLAHPKPPDPDPYPKKAIVGPPWIGLSLYHLIIYTREEIIWYLDQIVKAGGNMTEIFGLFSWYLGHLWQPYVTQPDHTYPDYPILWDLARPDYAIWAKIKFIIDECRKRNILLSIRHHDFCSMKKSEDMKKLAFRASVQRILYNQITGGLWGLPIQNWYAERWIRPLFTYIGDVFGTPPRDMNAPLPLHVPMNEADYVKGEGETDADADAAVIRFHDFYHHEFLRVGQESNMMISTSRKFSELSVRYGKRMEIHGISSPERMLQSIQSQHPFENFFLNGDGPDPYAGGQVGDKPEKRMPTAEQAKEMGRIIKEEGLFGWAGLSRAPEAPGNGLGIHTCTFEVLSAMREGIGE